MKLSNLFEDAFHFPLSNKKRFFGFAGINLAYVAIIAVSTFLFAYFNNTLIMSVGMLLAVIFLLFVSGYQLRTIKESIEGNQEPPELNNWVSMAIGGFKLGVVEFIYMIIPGVLILISLIPVFESIFTQTMPSFGTSNLVLFIIGMVLYIIYAFISPVIQSNLAYNGFKSAFNIPDILGRISTYGKGNYFLAVIVLILISLGIAAIGIVLELVLDLVVPLVGQFIVALIFYPFIMLFRSRTVALIYRETLETLE